MHRVVAPAKGRCRSDFQSGFLFIRALDRYVQLECTHDPTASRCSPVCRFPPLSAGRPPGRAAMALILGGPVIFAVQSRQPDASTIDGRRPSRSGWRANASASCFHTGWLMNRPAADPPCARRMSEPVRRAHTLTRARRLSHATTPLTPRSPAPVENFLQDLEVTYFGAAATSLSASPSVSTVSQTNPKDRKLMAVTVM